jgi:hypothetical protein
MEEKAMARNRGKVRSIKKALAINRLKRALRKKLQSSKHRLIKKDSSKL